MAIALYPHYVYLVVHLLACGMLILTVGSLYSTCCTKLSTNGCLRISRLLKLSLQHMFFINLNKIFMCLLVMPLRNTVSI